MRWLVRVPLFGDQCARGHRRPCACFDLVDGLLQGLDLGAGERAQVAQQRLLVLPFSGFTESCATTL